MQFYQRMVIIVDTLENTSVLQTPKKIKTVKSVKLERSQEEWQKLIDEAKRKEVFWTKCIIPGNVDTAAITGDEDLDYD